MSRPGSPLRSIIGVARAAVRRAAAIATIAAVLTVVPAVLLIAFLLSLATSMTHRLPLALDIGALALAVAIGVSAFRRWILRITDREVAASAESRLGFAAGELRSVLEMGDDAPAGTSQALLRRAEQTLAGRLSSVEPFALAGELGSRTQSRRVRALAVAGSLGGAVVLLAFAAPERSRASWSPLLRPVATIAESALPPLQVEPGDASAPRGSAVEVQVGAAQRDAVTLYWRARGAVLHEETLPVIAARAQARIDDIDAPVRYWVRAPDGALSDTFTITPIDPLLVAALSIDVVYPAYLSRTPERFDKDVPPLELPAGSELRIRGRSTRALSAVTIAAGEQQTSLRVSGSSFEGTLRPRASGIYEWQLAADAAGAQTAAPAPLDITVIADAAPAIEITYPGVDTLLPGDLKQLLVADAQDDHGVVRAVVVSWRTSATGQRDAPVEHALSLEGEADRKLVRGVLDATSRRLLPGDTLSYFVRVTDNSPMRQSATSRTFRLRVPGMAEMRERAQLQADELVRDAAAIARAMKQLETRTRDLQRRSASAARAGERGSGGSPGSTDKQLSSEQAQQAQQVLERQQAMTAEIEKLRDRIEGLQRAAEQAGLHDPEMQKRLEELRELYDQLLSPELKQQLDELRKALEKLDPEQVQKALEALARQQEQLREKLDQSLDLMLRAAAEQAMSKLSQEAKELAAQQEALADELKTGEADATESSTREEELEKRTDELGSSLLKLKKKLSEQGEADAAAKTGQAQEQTKDAADAMAQAAKQAKQNDSDQAGKSGEQAADKLSEAAQTLDAARKQMTASWKKDAQDAVDNATQDAINLAQKQKELLDRMKPRPTASAQAGNAQDKPQGGQQQSKPGQQGGQQGDQPSGESREKGQQQGGQAGSKGQGQQKPGEQGGSGSSSGQPGGSQGQLQQLRAEQAALKQGLEQLGKNLSDASQRSALVNKDVGSALARANLNMDETLRAMQNATQQNMPQDQAEQSLAALNRLALELLRNSQQIEQSEHGTGLQQALEQLAQLAKQQGNLNGRSNSLLPLNLGPRTLAQQLGVMAREQREIAQKLGGMNKGGARDDLLGRLDDLVKEADQIAKELEGGRLTPQTVRRQNELFHKLLDAGRTMERDEVSEERKADAAQPLPPSVVRALKPGLFDSSDRYAIPTAEQLRHLPPAYRRLVLEYFQKLNAAAATKETGAH
ncbi:MAG: hypothetical protein ACT443_12565 [Gemmatimonadota bacterium]